MDKQLQLKVSGLHCAGCGQRATAAVRCLDGVRQAESDLTTGEVRVVHDPTRIQVSEITDRLAAAGFATVGRQ